MKSIWDELGIAATSDERAIKRAYAARLRVTSPESDAAGYMKLRDAYEAAKSHAATLRAVEANPGAAHAEQASTEAPPAMEPVEVAPSPPSPQRAAFIELQALYSEQKLEEFLRLVADVQAANIFATLDERHDFIGEVAVLVQQADFGDVRWRGRLAAQLGAREHENIFARDTHYWFAYRELLDSYAYVRGEAAQAQAKGRDDVTATPGYLHVFHVLTSPFDAERLMAVTRSQTYLRIAEAILQRAESDPAIVIPKENREWWERTAMAGQHRPMADAIAATESTAASSSGQSSGFPFWPFWLLFVLLLPAVRSCSGSSTYSSSSPTSRDRMEEIRQLASGQMPIGPPTSTEMLLAEDTPLYRFSTCDPSTRRELISRLKRVPVESGEAGSAANSGRLKWRLVVDDSDPEVATLLAKCPPRPER